MIVKKLEDQLTDERAETWIKISEIMKPRLPLHNLHSMKIGTYVHHVF